MSPCRDGIVLGAAKLEDVNTPHLTVIEKGGTFSSHITPQDGTENRQSFPSINKKQIVEKIQQLSEENLIYIFPAKKMSQDVIYVTKEFEKWLDSIVNVIFQKKVTPKEVVYMVNFKKASEKIPKLIDEITKSPSTYIGTCKATEILEDESKIAGITKSKTLLLPVEGQLWSVNFQLLTGFNFNSTLEKEKLTSPFADFYSSMGIQQYIEELKNKKFFEILFSNEN